MSGMLCCFCGRFVDCDEDPDSLYVPTRPDECVCQYCREERELPSEFEK